MSPTTAGAVQPADSTVTSHAPPDVDFWSLLFVFVLASFIGLGVILLSISFVYQRARLKLDEPPAAPRV